MPLESGTTIASLNASWPTGGDPKSEGDDHLRLIKTVLKGDVYPKAEVYAKTETYDNTEVYTKAEGDARYLQPSEFFDPAGVNSWRIVGNTLEQWGKANFISGDALVTFQTVRSYASAPIVTIGPVDASAGDQIRTATAQNITGSGFNARGRIQSGGTTTATTNGGFNWHSIGEWDGAS